MTETLRSYENWQQTIRNFAWLTDAVSGATDIDVLIERNGQFFFVEGKPWTKGVRLPYGQHLCFSRLAKQPNTRFYLLGEEKDGDRVHVMNYNTTARPVFLAGKGVCWHPADRFISMTKAAFTDTVKSWWEEVSCN